MRINERNETRRGTSLQNVVLSADRTFYYDNHYYAVVRVNEHNPPKHIKVLKDGGVLCFNLRSHTLRVLDQGEIVFPTDVDIDVELKPEGKL